MQECTVTAHTLLVAHVKDKSLVGLTASVLVVIATVIPELFC